MSGFRLSNPAGVIAALGVVFATSALHCGPSAAETPGGEGSADTAQDDAGAGAQSAGRRSGADAADEPGAAPALSEAALAARYEAQRRYLGDDALFEDLRGRPVPALVTETEGSTEGSEMDDEDARAAALDDALLDNLPGSAGIGFGQDNASTTRANGNALGLFVPLEDAKTPALDHFYGALRELQAGEREKVRIAVYGASHTQADVYPGYMRRYFQERFGHGGRGYVSLTRLMRWYRTDDFEVESSRHWKIEHAQKRDRGPEGWLGLLGASGYSSNPRAWTRVSPRDPSDPGSHASRFEVQYVAHPGAGKFKLLADGKKIATVNAKAKAPGLGRHTFELPLGPHTIEVRPVGNGEVRLLGLIAERDAPGVVVDTLGISGTRAANMLRWDEAIWRDAITGRAPDLYTLFYGTNEATDTHQSIELYREELVEVLQRFRRALPEASCVLMGPGDFPREVEEGVWTVRPRVVEIVATQREVAYEMGCAFWDATAFMGGPGSMHTWATASPQMASRDHIHFTRRGYVRVGMAVTDAIMAGFDATP